MRASRLRSIVAASAVAAGTVIGAIGLTAPTAGAMPISEAQRYCGDAGGRWTVRYEYSGGTRRVEGYNCSYTDYYGNRMTDWFDRRGEYIQTCNKYECYETG